MKHALALAVVSVVVLAGCGGATTPPASPPSPGPSSPAPSSSPVATPDQTAALEQAVRAYSDACLSGDAGAAWELLSGRAQDGMAKDAYAAAIAQIAKKWGKAKMKSLKVVAIGKDAALVTYRYTLPAIDQVREPWIREGGAWRCDD